MSTDYYRAPTRKNGQHRCAGCGETAPEMFVIEREESRQPKDRGQGKPGAPRKLRLCAVCVDSLNGILTGKFQRAFHESVPKIGAYYRASPKHEPRRIHRVVADATYDGGGFVVFPDGSDMTWAKLLGCWEHVPASEVNS